MPPEPPQDAMSQDPSSFRALIDELKRRRVFRVVAAYAVVAWIMTQVTATVAPALHLPAWTLTLVVVLAILGFPVAAVLAWAYDVTPGGVQRTPGSSTTHARRAVAAVIIVVMLAATGWAGWRLRPAAAPLPESNTVAVMPFRVSADASLGHLGEGMLDLLAAKLGGVVGAAAVDPRTVLNALRQAGAGEAADLPQERAVDVARTPGARFLMLGEVVSVPPRLSLSARLVNVRDGSVAYRAPVDGPADSLPALVDRLAAQLLLVQAGEAEPEAAAAAEVEHVRQALASLTGDAR
jgi:TolB-like protein